MGTDTVVRNADGHPHRTFVAWALSYHLEYPSLVFVCNGETLALTVIAILGNE